MAESWELTNAEAGLDRDEWSIGRADVSGTPDGWSVTKRRLRGGKSDRVSIVEIDNGRMSIQVVPTRGMGVRRATIGESTLGWQSPVAGPVHPQFVPVGESSGLGWLAGFDELIARCGLESNGAPEFHENGSLKHPLHGRIANMPADRVTVSIDANADTISVTGEVDETRFLIHNWRLRSTLTTAFGSAEFQIRDVVTNRSAQPATFQMLYHTNIGKPLLEAGAKLVAPVTEVVPRNEHSVAGINEWHTYAAPQAGFEEQVYFLDLAGNGLGETGVLLKNASGTEGVNLQFNLLQLPCFTQWKNTAAVADGYVTGIEPATNLPNPRSFEEKQGRVIALNSGESHEMRLALSWLTEAGGVNAAEQEILSLIGDKEPKLHDGPQLGWCAGD